MHYYSHNIGDYRKDTAHLSTLEHGIYRQLIDWYYLDEKPIPKETQVVIRRLRLVSESDIQSLKNVLEDFFILGDDGYHQTRCDTEIAGYHGLAEKNRTNGKLGGRPKKTQTKPTENPNESQKNPNQEPLTNNHIKEANASSSTSDEPKIADCPHEVIIGLFAKHMPELPKPRLELWRSGKNAKALAQRWRWVMTAKKSSGERYAQTAEDAVAWFDRYFGYVAESDFLTGRKTEFACNMAWLVKAENFEKVLSGNFHKEMKVAA